MECDRECPEFTPTCVCYSMKIVCTQKPNKNTKRKPPKKCE